MNLFASTKSRLHDLVRTGQLSRAQMRAAQREAETRSISLTQALITLNLIDEAPLMAFLAERLEVPSIGLESLTVDEPALATLPDHLRARKDLLPLKKTGKTLTVAMCDPTDGPLLAELAHRTGLKILPMLAPLSALTEMHLRLEALAAIRHRAGKDESLRHFLPFFEKLTDYRFERVIGRGGFGLVSRCHQISLDRPVAIKVLNPDWNPIEHVAERFRREGRIIAGLDHPNIINVFEQGERHGFRFIVMEYFQGKPIHRHLDGKDLGRKLSVLRQVCTALQYAHSRGVIHRDIKPANILVNPMGAIKLLDFGVAHLDAGQTMLTAPEMILGTPKYMAPELQFGARHAGVASDVYAFGVMAYEILTGLSPASGELVHPTHADARVPPFLGDQILRCLGRQPEQRPEGFDRLAVIFQQAIDQMIFGEATDGRKLDATQTRQNRMQSLQNLYEIKSLLRQDDGGRLILAASRKLGREVVIKIMDAPEGLARLTDIAELHHPHIGEVFGIGRHESLVLVVGEHLSGGPLASRIQHEDAPHKLVAWLWGVIEALAHAEKAGLNHGHLHPNNVLFDESGVVKVVDFGLCGSPSPAYPQYHLRVRGTTPPQQDRHALGVMTFELLTGRAYPGGPKYLRHYGRVRDNPKIHPLLKYFLGRLWQVGIQCPPYPTYRDMLTDLERIGRRLGHQPDWTGDPTQPQAPAPSHSRTPGDPRQRATLIHRLLNPKAGSGSPPAAPESSDPPR